MRSRMAAMTRPDCSSERRSQPVGVLGGEDEDLVDAAGRGLGVDGAAVLDHEGVVAGEGGVEVGDDPDEPGALGAVGLEGGGGRPLVAGAEGTGPGGVGLDGGGAGSEVVGPFGPVDADDHPPAGERIQAELVHEDASGPTHARRPLRVPICASIVHQWLSGSSVVSSPHRTPPG